MRAGGIEDEPKEGGDAEGELKGSFPLPQFVGGDDFTFDDGDLSEPCDKEFPADDDSGDPDGTKVYACEVDEGRGYEDFVGEGVQQLTEGSDEVELPGKVSVKPVGDGGDDEGDQGDDEACCSSPTGADDKDRC